MMSDLYSFWSGGTTVVLPELLVNNCWFVRPISIILDPEKKKNRTNMRRDVLEAWMGGVSDSNPV